MPKIMRPIKITRTPATRIIQSFQMKIFQTNTYKTDLDWPHFNNERRVQEKQATQYIQFNVPISTGL